MEGAEYVEDYNYEQWKLDNPRKVNANLWEEAAKIQISEEIKKMYIQDRLPTNSEGEE